MKKNILIVLLMLITIIPMTSCKNNSITKKNMKTIVFEDKDRGYNTTFYYNKKEKFDNINQNNYIENKTLTFTNEELDAEFQLIYTTYTTKDYDKVKKKRKKQKNFQEYKFNKYDAYSYGGINEKIYMNILLNDKNKKEIVLSVTITRIDDNHEIIMKDVLDNKKVQDLFNTIEFSQEKK